MLRKLAVNGFKGYGNPRLLRVSRMPKKKI